MKTRICKKCQKEYPLNKEYFYVGKRNPEGFFSICKECERQRSRNYQTIHKTEIRPKHREWFETKYKGERKKAYDRKYRKEHPDIIKEGRRRFAKKHGYTPYRDIRRAQKLNVGGKYTKEDVDKQYKAQHGKCYWCNKPLKHKFHTDHVIPLCRGGSNGSENIVVACPFCNSSKGKKLPHEWGANKFL